LTGVKASVAVRLGPLVIAEEFRLATVRVIGPGGQPFANWMWSTERMGVIFRQRWPTKENFVKRLEEHFAGNDLFFTGMFQVFQRSSRRRRG